MITINFKRNKIKMRTINMNNEIEVLRMGLMLESEYINELPARLKKRQTTI